MACPPEIMARIGCARMVLARAAATPQRDIVSRLQTDAVVDLMRRQKDALAALGPDIRARVSALASGVAFRPDDLGRILQLLEPPEPKPATPRADMQTYTPNIQHYFTESEWSGMKGRNIASAMDLLITRLLQLGAKCLSEPCKAWCASLLLSLSGMGGSTESTKQQVHAIFKVEYARRRRKFYKTATFLGVPFLITPDSFKERHPEIYAEVFGSEDPVPSKIDFSHLRFLGVSCRASKSKSAKMLSLKAIEDREKEREAGPPIQMMQQLVSLQQDNLKLLRDSVRPAVSSPSSLLALAAQVPSEPRASVAGRLALPPAPPKHEAIVDGVAMDTVGGPAPSDTLSSDSQVVDGSIGGDTQLEAIPDARVEGNSEQGEDSLGGLQLAPVLALPRQQQEGAQEASMAIVPYAGPASAAASPASVPAVAMQIAPAPVVAPAAAGHALALQIMSEMGKMDVARKSAKADQGSAAVAKGNTKGKAKAKQAPETAKKAPPATKATPSSGPKGAKRSRGKDEFQDEATRMTVRVRLVDGSSKGFRYSSIEDKPRAIEEATAFLNLKKAEREAAEREAAVHA